MKLYELLG